MERDQESPVTLNLVHKQTEVQQREEGVQAAALELNRVPESAEISNS